MPFINNYIVWQGHTISINGQLVFSSQESEIADIPLKVYDHFGINYPKYFKMDMLSKVAFLATELLLKELPHWQTIPKENIALVLATNNGCLEVDRAYNESRKTYASPALFVYTLPNIMLGEICIRNGFKGEQMCTISEIEDIDFLQTYVSDLLHKRSMKACLCGFADATHNAINVSLRWVTNIENDLSIPFDINGISKTGLVI